MSANAGEIQRLLAAQAVLKVLIRVIEANRIGNFMVFCGWSNLEDVKGWGAKVTWRECNVLIILTSFVKRELQDC